MAQLGHTTSWTFISADHVNSTKPFSSGDEKPTSAVWKYSNGIKVSRKKNTYKQKYWHNYNYPVTTTANVLCTLHCYKLCKQWQVTVQFTIFCTILFRCKILIKLQSCYITDYVLKAAFVLCTLHCIAVNALYVKGPLRHRLRFVWMHGSLMSDWILSKQAISCHVPWYVKLVYKVHTEAKQQIITQTRNKSITSKEMQYRQDIVTRICCYT